MQDLMMFLLPKFDKVVLIFDKLVELVHSHRHYINVKTVSQIYLIFAKPILHSMHVLSSSHFPVSFFNANSQHAWSSI